MASRDTRRVLRFEDVDRAAAGRYIWRLSSLYGIIPDNRVREAVPIIVSASNHNLPIDEVISILTPRYYFADDFRGFYDYFLSQPHTKKVFRKGDYLWRPGQPYDRIHYFVSGAAVHFAEHESGKRKIISFHGPGTVLPGYHTTDFKIELSLTTAALSETNVLEFTIPQFQAMFEANASLSEQVVNWYSMYVNRFLFETIHQEFNSSQVKLCNLLYLLTMNQPANSGLVIEMTQEDLGDILGLSRVQITRELTELRRRGILATTRGKLILTDLPALIALCTDETI